MKITFANAPFYGDGWHGIRAGCRWPFIFNSPKPPENSIGGYNTYPFFMGYATTYLALRTGYNVSFYDALAARHTYELFYKTLAQYNSDIVVLETSTPSINNDLTVAKYIKENIGSEIALCGSHATVYAEELIKHDFVDYILQGEYEVGSYEMCLMRRKGIYKSKPLQNIDFMPLRGEFCKMYGDGFGHAEKVKFPQLQVWTSRGCPFKCSYCLWKDTMTFGNYRQRSVHSIIQEITHCVGNYGFKSVLLDDDTMNVGDKRTIEVSKAMEMTGLDWYAMVRADGCSWEAFEEMKAAGCKGLKIGVESFSQGGLDYVKKGYKQKELIAALNFLTSCGFYLYLSLMDNIPTETEDDRRETLYWKQHFESNGVKFQHPTCMPLPGTEMFKSLDSEGKIDKSDWLKFGLFNGEVMKKGD